MIRIGLTGGIASGKTTVAAQFALLGAERYDADHVVHVLLSRRGAIGQWVAKRFPEAFVDGRIDRRLLGNRVFGDAPALAELEAVMHPAVSACEEKEARRLARAGIRVMVSEIPLLFEIGAQGRYDLTVAATCPAFLQRQRAFRRPGMTPEKYARILARQLSNDARRRLANYEVFTGLGKAASMAAVTDIMRRL